ncbi:MAG: hypothetical protein C0503_02825 [Gemmatimonas sp.]|nr:hypothetical protein [Gemmatimonas sp.]
MTSNDFLPGSDGQPARRAGDYAQEKLAFLKAFMPPALSIAGRKPTRIYVDLFAGPGMNRTVDGSEFDGSPLLALEARATARDSKPFTDAHFVNLESTSHDALAARIARAQHDGRSVVPADRVRLHTGDANVIGPQLLRAMPRAAYVLLFADITGVKHWPWRSVEALRAAAPRSLDLYVLFPLEMTIERLLGIDRERAKRYEAHLDAFFGTDTWRAHYSKRVSSSQGAAFRTALIELYRARLRSLWKDAIVACAPGFSEDRALYRMFFATSHPAAMRAAKWAHARPPGGQMRLSLLD